MEPIKTNAPLARRVSGNAGKDTAERIVAKNRKNIKLDASIESLRLPEYETYLIYTCIAYIKALKLNRWRSARDAIEHALEVLHRLGFTVGRCA